MGSNPTFSTKALQLHLKVSSRAIISDDSPGASADLHKVKELGQFGAMYKSTANADLAQRPERSPIREGSTVQIR